MVHSLIGLALYSSRLRLPATTDLNLPLESQPCSQALVMAASLSAASLLETAEWLGIHASRICFPRPSLLHSTLAMRRIKACPLWCTGFAIAWSTDVLSGEMMVLAILGQR